MILDIWKRFWRSQRRYWSFQDDFDPFKTILVFWPNYSDYQKMILDIWKWFWRSQKRSWSFQDDFEPSKMILVHPKWIWSTLKKMRTKKNEDRTKIVLEILKWFCVYNFSVSPKPSLMIKIVLKYPKVSENNQKPLEMTKNQIFFLI